MSTSQSLASVLFVVALMGVMVVPVPANGPRYRLTPLGHLPDVTTGSRASDINNYGQVVGNDAGGAGNAFIWDATNGMRALPALPLARPTGSYASSINDAGSVAGWSEYPPVYDYTHQACVWNASGVVQGLGWLPLRPGETTRSYGDSSALGLNNLGTVVGRSNAALLWTSASGLQGLPQGLVEANAINDSDWVAGWVTSSEHYYGEAALLIGDVLTRLGPSTTRDSRAYSINGSGLIAGSVSWSADQNACVWYPDGRMVNIRPEGARFSEARDVNDLGQAVGWCGDRNFAFLWTEAEGALDLNSLLDGPYAGWQLRRANAINNLGWIVGTALNPSGEDEAFLLTPVPEPSSIVALLCGLGGPILRRRKR